MNISDIQPGLAVRSFDSRGYPVGKVELVEGDKYLRLDARTFADGRPRWIPVSWVDHIESRIVCINRSHREFLQQAITEAPSLA